MNKTVQLIRKDNPRPGPKPPARPPAPDGMKVPGSEAAPGGVSCPGPARQRRSLARKRGASHLD